MISALFPSSCQLKRPDFYFIHRRFCQVINTLLPVRAASVFWCRTGGDLSPEPRASLSESLQKQLAGICASGKPGHADGFVVIPISIEDGEIVAVILKDIDQGLVEKMAMEWLLELQEKIREGLTREKQRFVHPETGLYNSRFLEICLNQTASPAASVFLMSILHRTRPAADSLLNVIQTSRLLEASVSGQVFYLGGNLYGVYQEGLVRDDALGLARRLLTRLKREGGVLRVHIGIAVRGNESAKSAKAESTLFRHCWQALETAERRGPFSLCEASSFLEGEKQPLAKPSLKIQRQLQKLWRGQEQFGLLLFQTMTGHTAKGCTDLPAQGLSDLVADNSRVVRVSSTESYVVLPGMSEKETIQYGKQLKKKMDIRLNSFSVALGICFWPCLNGSKIETARNCRRALMHGDFLGPDSLTVFDHVSLNVSGDYFFDEGDYRQAVKDYRLGLQIEPDDINLLNSLGVALTELNRHRQAVQYFEQVLSLEPSNFMALVNKGFALRMLGRTGEALACFERVAQSRKFAASSVFSDISLQLGRLYCKEGAFAKAARVLERLKKSHGDKQGFYLYSLLGEAYAGTKKNDRAINALQQAVRLNPHDAQSLSILGELYAREGQGNDIALVLCKQALAIDDKPWQYWFRLAFVKHKASDCKGARIAVLESLRRNRLSKEALFLAGDVFSQLGEKKKAVAMYRRLGTLLPDDKKIRRALKKIQETRK